MDYITLSKKDSAILSGVNDGGAGGKGAWVCLVAGNEDANVLLEGVVHDIKLYDTPCAYASTNFDVENNPVLFEEDHLIEILKQVLSSDNHEAKDIIWSVFKGLSTVFNGFTIEDGRIVSESVYTDCDQNITSYNASYRAIFSLLLEMFIVKDGIIVISNFDVSGYRANTGTTGVIEGIFAMAQLSRNTVILQTDKLNTVNAYIQASQPAELTCSLVTMRGNTIENCTLMAQAQAIYDAALKTITALNM